MSGHNAAMSTVAEIFAVIAGLVHVAAFAMESLLFHRASVRRIMTGRTEDVPAVRIWAFNQGFYNLFLAVGAFAGVYAWMAGHETVGDTLVLFSCSAMALAGIVLAVSDHRLWRGALGQSIPPAIAVVATLLA
jgi:putative membrane protein